jgi:hypothetical protein
MTNFEEKESAFLTLKAEIANEARLLKKLQASQFLMDPLIVADRGRASRHAAVLLLAHQKTLYIIAPAAGLLAGLVTRPYLSPVVSSLVIFVTSMSVVVLKWRLLTREVQKIFDFQRRKFQAPVKQTQSLLAFNLKAYRSMIRENRDILRVRAAARTNLQQG